MSGAFYENILQKPLTYLKGVGPQRAEMLSKELGLVTYEDLLLHFPFRHVDRTQFTLIKNIQEENVLVQLKVKLKAAEMVRHGKKRLVLKVQDESAQAELLWFNGIQWIQKTLMPGQEYIVFGKASIFNGKVSFIHPEWEPLTTFNAEKASRFEGVYSTTEKLKNRGITSKSISRLLITLFGELKANDIPEILPKKLLEHLKLPSKYDALRGIHIPQTADELKIAETRLKFEELYLIQAELLRTKKLREQSVKGYVFQERGELFDAFYKKLPYQLTEAQQRVIKEIYADMRSGRQLNRLLQGDVGSGKTIVALICSLFAIGNGFQASIMAPTEILAQQHFNAFKELLKDVAVRVELLTGSIKGSKRNDILQDLLAGNIDILIGTHALIEDHVKFKNLGFVVIDEQHRFGVGQRAKLYDKNTLQPHVLIMTATPIPRTLYMTLYGDLDVSVIDQMPPGRKAITTSHRYDKDRLKVFQFMKQEIAAGRQIYLVYPLIEESEKLDYKDLMDGYESICREFPLPHYAISIVHGRMKADDKDFEMQRFVKGETQIMVATTVIEVGVNVPNASVMVIESAQRFGLSQLHQLRGRVGRGAEQSYCILMTDFKLSSESRERIKIMCDTNDGFKISEADLRLRGPGNIAGTKQSGSIVLRLADLTKDQKILGLAREWALKTIEADPLLQNAENAALKYYLKTHRGEQFGYSRVS